MRTFWTQLFFICHTFLFAETIDSIFEGGSDPTIVHHVNVISGQLNLSFVDTVIEGAVGLPICRSYTSAGTFERDGFNFDLEMRKLCHGFLVQGGWSFLPQINLLMIQESFGLKNLTILSYEKNGGTLLYKYSHKHETKSYIHYFKPDVKVAQYPGNLSGKSNPKNNLLEFNEKKNTVVIHHCSGTQSIYQGDGLSNLHLEFPIYTHYQLQKEVLPNQHCFYYSYDKEGRLSHVELTNPNKSVVFADFYVGIEKSKSPFKFQIKTSDNKTLFYGSTVHEQRDYLNKVSGNCCPAHEYHFLPGEKYKGARIAAFVAENELQLTVDYHKKIESDNVHIKWGLERDPDCNGNKVAAICAPIGKNGVQEPIATFEYFVDYTAVRDQSNRLTCYHHVNKRLDRIERFDQAEQLYSITRYIWEEDRLKAEVFLNHKKEPLYSKVFTYDSYGNVIQESFYGNLRTRACLSFHLEDDGSLQNAERKTTRYYYDPNSHNLIGEKQENGLSTLYAYLENTNLITAKLKVFREKIVSRQFYQYDHNHLLSMEISDDGTSFDCDDLENVSERHIKSYIRNKNGVVETTEEKAFNVHLQTEELIKRSNFQYGQNKLPAIEEVFDSNGDYAYRYETAYDHLGNVTYKSDPMGQKERFVYDNLSRLISMKKPDGTTIFFQYNALNFPIEIVEVAPDGHSKTTKSVYNSLGQLIKQVDPYGHETIQYYDEFDRCTTVIKPKCLDENGSIYQTRIDYTYDVFGNVHTQTVNGTKKSETYYTAENKPYLTIDALGSHTETSYGIDFDITTIDYHDGSKLTLFYDPFHRLIKQVIKDRDGQTLSTETWNYSAFHLSSHLANNGLLTTYEYDAFGRKVKEIKGDRETVFSYDPLGFISQVSDGVKTHHFINNCTGLVIEEWDELSSGEKENHIKKTYNNQNQLESVTTITSVGLACDTFTYDEEGRVVTYTDPIGAQTNFSYDYIKNTLGQSNLEKTTTDAEGNQTTDAYDGLSRLIKKVKINSNGDLVYQERLHYNAFDQLTKQQFFIYQDGTLKDTHTLFFTYDALNRKIEENDNNLKITRFAYDIKNRITQKILPSGDAINYTYDALDRIKSINTSDRGIHQRFFYGEGFEATQIMDFITHLTIKREYNRYGELVKETTSDQLTTSWEYDAEGRRSKFTLPDQSSIHYTYYDHHLQSVSRSSKLGSYSHAYNKFSKTGFVEEEQLIFDLGTLRTFHDLLDRPILATSNFQTTESGYNRLGLLEKELLGTKEKTYNYDALHQLTLDDTTAYSYDSAGNFTHFTTNSLNQITSTPNETLTYDANGNIINRTSDERSISYEYNLLGQLTSLIYPNERKITFLYDPLSRLYAQKEFVNKNGKWIETKKFFYLYDDQVEIGKMDSNHTIYELKINGAGLYGEIGSTIALELQGSIYAPLHDLRGNIIGIISSEGTIKESYELDSFGQGSSTNATCPWRFSSKRHIEDLIYFGMRFYDPTLKRWITPDPAGYVEGINLYAFVSNSPTNRLDLYGLLSCLNYMDIEIDLFRFGEGGAKVLPGTCRINDRSINCFVSSSAIQNIKITHNERKKGVINLSLHYHEIMPTEGSMIGCVTAVNGVNTNYPEFREMCDSIVTKLPGDQLFIGFHNDSPLNFDTGKNFLNDKSQDENSQSPRVEEMATVMNDLSRSLMSVNDEMHWLQISHSYGGLVFNNARLSADDDTNRFLSSNLLYLGLAPAIPFPKQFAKEAINVVSESDKVVCRFLNAYKNNPDYNLEYLKCLSPKSLFSTGDHGFFDKTLQTSLRNELKNFDKNYGFYRGRQK
jgi:RHS repeat-associated protein